MNSVKNIIYKYLQPLLTVTVYKHFKIKVNYASFFHKRNISISKWVFLFANKHNKKLYTIFLDQLIAGDLLAYDMVIILCYRTPQIVAWMRQQQHIDSEVFLCVLTKQHLDQIVLCTPSTVG